MKVHESTVLLLAEEADVPFNNSRADKKLRMGKVKQKVNDYSANANMPMPAAKPQATCIRWYAKDTIYWLPFNLSWPGK